MKNTFSKAAASDESTLKAAQLKRLGGWISETSAEIEKGVPLLKSRIGHGKFAAGTTYFISGLPGLDGFSRNDLKALKPALCELHTVCKTANIAVDISGFDLLPRVAAVSQGAYVSDPEAFFIAVDTRREYNYVLNPYSDQALADEKKPRPSIPGGSTCSLG